jgi:hypothetical protein
MLVRPPLSTFSRTLVTSISDFLPTIWRRLRARRDGDSCASIFSRHPLTRNLTSCHTTRDLAQLIPNGYKLRIVRWSGEVTVLYTSTEWLQITDRTLVRRGHRIVYKYRMVTNYGSYVGQERSPYCIQVLTHSLYIVSVSLVRVTVLHCLSVSLTDRMDAA